MPGPLDDITVIELSRVMPGAITGMLLADHGADVIKVEPKGGAWFAHHLTRKSWDRGKKSVELDYDEPEQLKTICALIARADVLIHAFEQDEAARLGLDPASLEALNPRLVSCALIAYGSGTPLDGRPYGESLAAARLGTMIERRSLHREGPVYLGYPALHYGQAFVATIDILAALNARHVIGAGQATEASLTDGYLAQIGMGSWWQEDGISFSRKGAAGAADRFGHTRLITGMFECGDGLFLQMHTGGARGFKYAMDVLGFGDRVRDVGPMEMSVPLDDDEYQIARVEIFVRFKTRPRDEWIGLFHARDVAALPVLEPAEVLLDEQVQYTQHCIALPDADFGTIYQAAPALRFRNNPPATPHPAPMVGADNHALNTLLQRPFLARLTPQQREIHHPLEGLRVLDFSSFFACGYGARLLSDLGADVIKIEAPSGDQMRPLPNPFEAAQRGKRCIALDLKKPEALKIMRELVQTADVVMHNFRPGKAEKIGIGYDQLRAINPGLIYAYLPGYGSTGPKTGLKSFAPLVSGWTGLLCEGGGEGNPPTNSVFGNEDYNNGLGGAVGVLMALHRHNLSGGAEYLECSQLQTSLFTTSENVLNADHRVVYGLRLDQSQSGFSALDRIYPTQDGWICICCNEDRHFAALAEAIGAPQWAGEERFRTARSRDAHDGELQATLAAFFAERTRDDAFATLDAKGVPCEKVLEESWSDGFFWQDWAIASDRVFDHRQSMHGHIREVGIFNHLARTKGVRRGPAPRLGEHSGEILSELNYSKNEMERLSNEKVIIM